MCKLTSTKNRPSFPSSTPPLTHKSTHTHTHTQKLSIHSHFQLSHSHLPTPSVPPSLLLYTISLPFSLISFTLLLIPPQLLALYLRNDAVFALPPLAGVQLAMNRSVKRSVMATYPRGTVAMASLLIIDVAQLHGPRDWFSHKISLFFLRLGGRGAARAPGVSSLHVPIAPARPAQADRLPASILQGKIRSGAGTGPVKLLPVPARVQPEQLPCSMTRGEAIIILLNATVRRLHHLSRPVCHQVQGVVRARAARAFVVAATAVLAVVPTMVFAASGLWLLVLGHRFLPT